MIRSIIIDYLKSLEPKIAAVLAWVALGFAGAAACVTVESSPIARDGNLTCMYDGAVVFSGGFKISGNGADRLDLSGTWRLCNSEGVTCTLTSTAAPKGE